ncbi:MAG: hypothetical protein L0332_31335 [Chloroflexi bacterium]|nr:hypothetical protein [Chloroflexota bacterium]MCI0650112.1 hypothetical protein [Chloroflexota bacterium]MCI0731196.1 hypothetical protein [Chloroflexota bacterium]
MTDLAFALHLGNGVYLDSDGNIHHGPAPATVIYEAEFKLPIDPKKAAAALKSVSDTLNGVDKSQKVTNDIIEIYGFVFGTAATFDVSADALLGLLSKIGKVAGAVAPVLLVASFAIDIARVFNLFGGDELTKFDKLVLKRFDAIDAQFDAIAEEIKGINMTKGRVAADLLVAAAIGYVDKLKNSTLTPSQLAAESIKFNTSVSANIAPLLALLDLQSWMTLFDPNKHSQIWGLMQHHLFFLPSGSGGSPVQARLSAEKSTQFDHRLMVPLASYATEAFLVGVRAGAPEYRSTGYLRHELKLFADAIARLAQAMRAEVLALTIYAPKDFDVLLDPAEVIHDFFSLEPITMSPLCSRFPVGALDLRYHDNLFFEAFFTQLFKAEVYGWESSTRKACMDFRWLPPANLTVSHDHNSKFDGYRITNLAECAAAANAQSELDYAELLSVSGYPQLMQLATLLRHESTDPNISQTVQVYTSDLKRVPQPSVEVTIESEPVPLTDKITASARREPQKCTASVYIWTQPIERELPIEYTIKLRTLKSIWRGRWHEPVYSAFQFVHYEPDPADRNFMTMVIDIDPLNRGIALFEHSLIAGHSTTEGPRHADSPPDFKLKAHTFDWWIPIKPPFSLEVPLERTEQQLRGLGRSATTADTTKPRLAADVRPMPDPSARFAKTSDVFFENSFPKLSFLDGTQDWEGEHRELKETDVKLKYHLDWDADRMHITLEADPAARNYVVWVVVEEKLQGGKGNVLHTAIPVPMNGQLTYVPQSFFDAERAAIEKAAKAAAEFNRKYSISTEVGPDDPIVGWLRPGDLATTAGLTKVMALAEQHQPEILREVLAADQSMSSETESY